MTRMTQLVRYALLIVGSAACGGSGGDSPTAPVPRSLTVQVLDFSFQPKQLTINPGDTVRWVLQGNDTTHTTTALDLEWDSEFVFLEAGDSYEWTSTTQDAGKTYEYRCITHADSFAMRGSISVGQNAPPPSPGY